MFVTIYEWRLNFSSPTSLSSSFASSAKQKASLAYLAYLES